MCPYCGNHFRKPKRAQRHDDSVADHKHDSKPPWRSVLEYERCLNRRVSVIRPRDSRRMERCPYIAEKCVGKVGAP